MAHNNNSDDDDDDIDDDERQRQHLTLKQRPSHWVAEELMRQDEEMFGKKNKKRKKNNNRIDAVLEEKQTFFRIVKKFLFPKRISKPAEEEKETEEGEDEDYGKEERENVTREMVANRMQEEEDEEADDPPIEIPALMRGDYSLLWLRDALDDYENQAAAERQMLDRDIVGDHVKKICKSFVFVSVDSKDPRNGGEALRQSAREVLEMCCMHVEPGGVVDKKSFWENFRKRLQRLLPTSEMCKFDTGLDELKMLLMSAQINKDLQMLSRKSNENIGKFENALREFVQLTMEKVNEEFASWRATSIDQLAMHHQDGWLSMRNAHVNWNRRKGMGSFLGEWPAYTLRIAEEGDLDLLVGAKSDEEEEEEEEEGEEEEEEEERPRRQKQRREEQRQQQNESPREQDGKKQPKAQQQQRRRPRELRGLDDFNSAGTAEETGRRRGRSARQDNKWSALGKRRDIDEESSDEATEDIPMPVLPPNKGRSKSTSRGKSSNRTTPMLDELVNATLQAANQENQQREPNVISQPSVRGPSKKRAPPFFNSPARPAVAENDGFDALKKALEEREAKEKAEAEKAAATAKKISAEVEEEEEEEEPQPEVDDGFARLRAELEKREKEKKKKSEPSRSGWAFLGKRKEPEKEEEEEPLDGDDEEEENDSDIIPTQQIGGDDDDDDIEDKDAIDSQQREKRGRFFNLFGNKTPSESRIPVKQPSPRPSPPRQETLRISSPREDDDDFDDGPFQIPDDDNDDDQPIAIVPEVVQQQESPPKPRQPNQRVQPRAEQQQQQQYQQRYQNRPAQPAERRRTGKFTEEEVRAIIRGVETHGSGNWKVIREQSLDGILLGRTPVDLKDKYRNLQSSDLKRVLSGILPRSGSYPFVEEHFEKVRREREEGDN